MIGDEVSEANEYAVRRGVELMHDYSVSLGRPNLDHDIHVYAFDNFERFVDHVYEALRETSGDLFSKDSVREYFANGNFVGKSATNYAFINTSIFDDKDLHGTAHVTAHEFNHAQFNNLGTLGLDNAYAQSPDVEPRWLEEGIAEFLAYQVLSEGGIDSYEDQRKRFFPDVFDVRALEQMERWSGFIAEAFGYGYESSTLAVELLASYAGQSSLLGFYTSLTLGITWEDQFHETFGLSVDDFYVRFAEHEANGFPRLETPKFIDE